MSREEIMYFAEMHGPEYGLDMLILAGPDGFEGSYADYCELYDELEEIIYNGC